MPDIKRRRAVAESLRDCMTDLHVGSSSGKHWGKSDYGLFGQWEVCLMYYTIAGMNDEIESTLSGERPDKEDNHFYPTAAAHRFSQCTPYVTSKVVSPLCKKGYMCTLSRSQPN